MKDFALISLICTTVFLSVLYIAIPDAQPDDIIDQVDMLEEMVEDIDQGTPGFEDPKDVSRNWAVRLGIITGFTPDYEGSNDYEFNVGPYLSITWKDRIWFKGKSIGANILRRGPWRAGPLVAKSGGRDEDDNDKLKGLDDVDGSIAAGGFLRYKKKPWRFDVQGT